MIPVIRESTRVFALLVLGVFAVACHKNPRVRSSADVSRVTKDTAVVVPPITDTVVVAPRRDTSVIAFFKDTAVTNVFSHEGQIFKLPAQRQALRTTLAKERALWQDSKPRDYRFLLRVACFCPGPRGWLLMEVRNGKLLRAWDRTGKPAALSDWNTFSIDGLYDNLQRTAEINGQAQIAFDPRWHFPKFVYSVVLPGPDAWSTIEVRGLRPIR